MYGSVDFIEENERVSSGKRVVLCEETFQRPHQRNRQRNRLDSIEMTNTMDEESWEKWKRKRQKTFLGYIIVGVIVGIDYSVVFSTLYLYLRDTIKTEHLEVYYGLIIAAYSVSSTIFGMLTGRWLDKTRSVKLFTNITLVLQVIGSILYVIPFHVAFPLIGRFIAGSGDPFTNVCTGEVVRTYNEKESTVALWWLASCYSIGLVIGPVLPLTFSGIGFQIGPVFINEYNFIGLFMASLLLVAIFIVNILMHDCSKEIDLKEYLKECNDPDQIKDQNMNIGADNDSYGKHMNNGLENTHSYDKHMNNGLENTHSYDKHMNNGLENTHSYDKHMNNGLENTHSYDKHMNNGLENTHSYDNKDMHIGLDNNSYDKNDESRLIETNSITVAMTKNNNNDNESTREEVEEATTVYVYKNGYTNKHDDPKDVTVSAETTTNHHNNVTSNGDVRLYVRQQYLPTISLTLKRLLSNTDVSLLFVSTFVCMYSMFAVDVLVPLIILVILKWDLFALVIFLIISGIVYALILFIMSKLCTTNRSLYYTTVICTLSGIFMFFMIICIKFKEREVVADIFLVILLGIFWLMTTCTEEVLIKAILAKMVPSAVQSFTESVRNGISSVATIIAAVSTPLILSCVEWWSLCLMVVVALLLLAYGVRRRTLINAKEIDFSEGVHC